MKPEPEEQEEATDLLNATPEDLPTTTPEPAASSLPPSEVPTASDRAFKVSSKGEPLPIDTPPQPEQAAPTPSSSITTTTNTATTSEPTPSEQQQQQQPPQMFPPNVLAAYLAPMRHPPTYGIPVASLQLRSFSIRNLEFFADFCMRAAFYLKMPASGPVPLPRRTERWTVLKSNFVNKKSQENFERITYKRVITVMDAEKEAVEAWLAFVRRWQFYGVGMKANVWEFCGVEVGKEIDQGLKGGLAKEMEEKLGMFGWRGDVGGEASISRMLRRVDRERSGVGAPLSEVGNRYKSGDMRRREQGLVD